MLSIKFLICIININLVNLYPIVGVPEKYLPFTSQMIMNTMKTHPYSWKSKFEHFYKSYSYERVLKRLNFLKNFFIIDF